MSMIPQSQSVDYDSLWKKSLVRVTDEFSLPPVILQVDDAIIGTLGNFSASTGKAKAKKTFNVSAIVAAALINGQVLEYRASLPSEKRKILYFDTEQSPFHCKLVLQRILKLAGLPLNQQPENLIFSHLREISDPAIRCEVIRKAIYEIEGVGLVVIDGIRDLILDDINNPTQSTILIGNLMQWTSERGIHIQTVLHLNKGDDNSRGHIGTELNNKAETVLQVTKDPTAPIDPSYHPHLSVQSLSRILLFVSLMSQTISMSPSWIQTFKMKRLVQKRPSTIQSLQRINTDKL